MHSIALPHVSLFVACLCALLQVGLTALVIRRRVTARIGFLDGGDPTLLRRMRAHGNFVETAPMALLLLLMLELAGLPRGALWAMGLALAFSRVVHAWGLLAHHHVAGRVAGTLLGILVLSAEAVACAWLWWR
jgi:uncharacterized protein